MKSTMLTASICALVLACAAPQKGGKAETTDKTAPAGMVLVSTAFEEGELVSAKYSAYGENVSPDLAWEHAPEGVRSFALICRDPDAPGGTFYHWVVFNIPDTVKLLPDGLGRTVTLPFGGTQGTNSFGRSGYDARDRRRGRTATSSTCTRWMECSRLTRPQPPADCGRR
jgi:phosphatidylethanolamine-binding protein (PEBP) family uncharacterized protein